MLLQRLKKVKYLSLFGLSFFVVLSSCKLLVLIGLHIYNPQRRAITRKRKSNRM